MFLSAGEQVAVTSHAHSSGADGAELETKSGTVEAEEAGVDIDFKMPTGTDMSLPVAFVFSNFST